MKHLILILSATLCLLLNGPARAQNVLIQNATLHTMGPAGVLENTDVLVTGGNIRKIGTGLPVPQDDFPVFDAKGKPVTPGFFAGLNSLGLEEISQEAQTLDGSYASLHDLGIGSFRPEFDITSAYNPHSSLVPVTRIEGYSFTMLTARRSGSIIAGQGRLVSLEGGYDSFLGRHVLFVDVGADASGVSGGSRAAQWMLLEQAMAEAGQDPTGNEERLLSRAGRKVLSDYADGGTVVFNVDRASDILQTIKFAGRHGLHAVIAGGAEAWMVKQQLAEAGVAVLLDPLQNLPHNFDMLGARLDNAALLHQAGVTIAFAQTPDMESHTAFKMRQLAGNAVAHGLPYDAALKAMTIDAAAIFGIDKQAGSIEKGKRGDLVIWSGDPLEVTSVAERVIIGGQVIPMESRQTKLRDRYLPENPDMPRAYIKP
jgi:imidazolonepropionase-like amidohydrolase